MTATSVAAGAPVRSLTVAGIGVLALGALDFGLEQSIILPALPDLADHYGASLVGVAWLGTSFLLASIVAVPLIGRLGDLFGKRLMLLASLGAFAIGSLICALTGSIALAIAGRAIQGLGAAVAPLAYGLVRDTFAPELLPRAVGIVVAASNVGGAIGFLLSGLLVDHLSPEAVFWFLFAVAIVLMAAVAGLVQESPVRAPARLDIGGAAFLALGLVALLLAISKGSSWGWSSARVGGLFAAAVLLLGLFVLVEHRVRQPLVDLALFVTRPFVNANLCAFAFGFAFFLAVFVVPQIAAAPKESGYGLALSTTGVGVLLIPTGLAGFVSSWVGGRLVDRVGPRTLVAGGSIVGIAAYVLLALVHDGAVALSAGSALLGLAWGFILTGYYPVVIRGASLDKTGVAVAVNVVVRNTAVSVGVQAAFAIIVGAGTAGAFQAESGYTRAFVLGAAGAGLALLTAALMPGRVRTAR
jgi:MFS family permease